MAGELKEATENLVVPSHGAPLVDLFQHCDRLTAAVTLGVAEVDRTGEWELDGSANMVAWMRVHLGMTNQTARRMHRLARRLRDLPVTAQAWLNGDLSGGQVEVIVENVTDRRAALFAEHEAEIIPSLPSDVLLTTTAMRDWAAKADAVLDSPEPPEEPTAAVQTAKTVGRRGYVRGSFDEANFDVITKAIEVATANPVPGEPYGSMAMRQGQALVDVCRFFLNHQDIKDGGRKPGPPQHRHPPTRPPRRESRTEPRRHPRRPGHDPPAGCDANIHRVITDGKSHVLDYGRATRTIPPAVYTSLVVQDRGCRFPGCDRPAKWTEGHHIQHWEHGGPTCPSNLAIRQYDLHLFSPRRL